MVYLVQGDRVNTTDTTTAELKEQYYLDMLKRNEPWNPAHTVKHLAAVCA